MTPHIGGGQRASVRKPDPWPVHGTLTTPFCHSATGKLRPSDDEFAPAGLLRYQYRGTDSDLVCERRSSRSVDLLPRRGAGPVYGVVAGVHRRRRSSSTDVQRRGRWPEARPLTLVAIRCRL